MKKILIGFYILSVSLLAYCALSAEDNKPNEITNEEYNVYSALINLEYVKDGIKLIVIDDYTTTSISPGISELKENFRQEMPESQQETIDGFRKINQLRYLLKRQFSLPVDYVLVNEKEINDIFPKKGWDSFYEKYPNSQGEMTLSRVGFNTAKSQALVYVGNQSHFLSGEGYIFLLVKENNIWKVKQKESTWES